MSIGTLGILNCTVLSVKCHSYPTLSSEALKNVTRCSISSHISLSIGWIGQTGNVPSHPKSHCPRDGLDRIPKVSHAVCPIPTVHPIPLYHGTYWTDWGCHLCHCSVLYSEKNINIPISCAVTGCRAI